jgi:cysteine synthase A
MIYQNILELIGNTPIIKLNKMYKFNNVYAKLEMQNPIGSIKDRAVYQMINDYLAEGKIKKGDTIIEPTSGNTGIALASLVNYFELQALIIMPYSSSIQRRELIKAYGGELILVNGGMKECEDKAKELNKTIKRSVILGQFENESNRKTHYLYTAKEIEKDIKDVDVIICGIGTGGTISGIGRYFKENNPSVEIIGVEPKESSLLTKGIAGEHKIQGIGPNFVPNILDLDVVDRIISVSYKDSVMNCKTLTMLEGYLVGISSGAVLEACNYLLKEEGYKNKKILLIFPDSGERYSWN